MAEQALLAAIAAHPADDAYRLVYADWLDEQGEAARAEFIRVECEQARTDRDDPAYLPLLRRSAQLLKAGDERWFGPLADERIVGHVITERGFIDTVVLGANQLTEHAEIIATYAPLARGLHIEAGGCWREFFAVPWLASLTSLTFASQVCTDETLAQLAQSRYTEGLEELDFARQGLTPAALAVFASVRWPMLERLVLSENDLVDTDVEVLVANNHFPNVRQLDLSENELLDGACRALAAAEDFGQLEQLALSGNRISAAGIAALAGADHLDQLRELYLNGNPIGPEGGHAILASRALEGLKMLDVIGCGVGVEVVNHLRWVFGNKAVKA